MFYVGIDVAKKTHHFVILDNEGEKATKPFSLQNTQENFQKLLNRLKELNLSPENTLAGLEATGSFWENLYSFLTKAGYKVKGSNPHQTNKFREALRKKASSDDIDALLIAGLLRSGDTAASYVPEEEVQTLRELTKMRYEFVKDRKNYQRQVYSLLEVYSLNTPRPPWGIPLLLALRLSSSASPLLVI